ncbi:bifunctional YncE family protein/alkaline phosphatase family protein [Amycolatopsis saalfeldensis]|uniref:40-residue YVTN family beta-propeller repeat-containing protein n=1 Tax=Amycolatopsis saalfeldensis TaxID=394193 RepID=A0A1H8S9E1_9PSEU|nr:alkaline phosphatase family protein [Amycolatopsis saalfeldensis]SEO75669.1 40-residue YVTN family beta-propeller repeat-containing protein [Amycolatopsis saalfeldensis]
MQVTRHRRTGKRRQRGRRVRLTITGAAIFAVVAGTGVASASTQGFGTDQVGQNTDRGLVLSSDQYIAPVGDRLVVNNGKIMASTVSPDGGHLAALTTDGGIALTIVDLKSWKVQQLVGNSATANLRIPGNDVGQEGPSYSPDGKTLWMAQTDGYRRFTVNPDGTVANPSFVPIPADGPKHGLPAQAVFSPDGKTVYAAVNGQNRVIAINAGTGDIQQSWAVGNAPRDLALVGSRLYVGNEGGRAPRPGETTINSYNTQVPADPVTGSTTTGTVSVIDLAKPAAAVGSIDVGLHPTALYAKNGTLFVANTNSNNVSVIDTGRNKVIQTIATQPWPEATVGYEPDGITLTNDGHLLVTLGRANALAVYRYSSPKEPVSYVGLLPTDYFPTAVTTVGKDVLISNTRGIDARRPTTAAGHGTHDTTASLQRFTLPDDRVIRADTAKVFQQNGWTPGSVQVANGQGGKRPVPVPARLGDPSTIKHVFLIVKENRTYDQLFGDIPAGDGDPALAQFGANVTPNQHALTSQFGLYDNTYDIGTNSAEGHNWLMQADNPEYTESSAGEYLRSYDTEDDALGHQSSGFLWSGAQATGNTVRDFGEFNQFETTPAGSNWQSFYCDSKNMAATGEPTALPTVTSSPIPSLNDVTVHSFPKFDTGIPDVYRYQIWKQDFEKNGPANLNMFWLSSDHTGGPPSPAAQVADNDLAVGKMVDTISHSPYWKDSAIFVVEDDSQAGLDHVDGHRAPIQVISPWAQHGTVDNHYYSQITMIRTIEQILGVQPMNQKDSAATPMAGAFTKKPDYTPFNAVPNRTSLTAGLPTPPACGADTTAPAPSTVVPASQQPVAAQWQEWTKHQRLTGPNATADYANPTQMNHFTWYQMHGWTQPYPGENKIFTPDQVPGAAIPSAESDG